MGNINFGIDLGTTNSGVGEFESGKVSILKNPVGFQETLPSVVAYKGERIIIGNKAKEILFSSPDHVFSAFKRKMGTTEEFLINDLNVKTNPVELSSLILNELLSFKVGEKIDSAVITIPASFDTIQSNATKEAGFKAGLSEVVLLQEPIAACLAYSNENDIEISDKQHWLVYDFGGGTFDAALVKIDNRELKVIDHKGNNFLGGVDLDLKLLKTLILPKLGEKMGETDLWTKINSNEDIRYSRLGKYLNYLAEEVKKELSIKTSAWMEIEFKELDLAVELEIKREEFNGVIEEYYADSLTLVNELLQENEFENSAINRIVMVGGTTYIPFIRQKLAEDTGIPVDTSIDPTTAIVKGAAFYAGTRPKKVVVEEKDAPTNETSTELNVNLSFESMTQDEEELIAFSCGNKFNGSFRITRLDGGYDSGITTFEDRGKAFVTVLPKQVNTFHLVLMDQGGNTVYQNNQISITHGFYNISGQPLPHDICLELDSDDETYLELIFKRNTILPLKKTLYKTFSKSIAQGSNDKIVLNVVEGQVGTMPGANMNIGYTEIKGSEISGDLIKGTDLELTFEISESRDLNVEIYIPSIDQVIKENFSPEFKGALSPQKTIEEINLGLAKINGKMHDLEISEQYEQLGILAKYKRELEEIIDGIESSNNESLTDSKYQLQDKKRRILREIDKLDMLDDLAELIEEYNNHKTYIANKVDSLPPALNSEFNQIIKNEKQFLQLNDKYLIKRKIKALDRIASNLFMEQEENYIQIFIILKTYDESAFNNIHKVRKLFAQGEKEYEKNDYPKLKAVCLMILSELKDNNKQRQHFSGTGLK